MSHQCVQELDDPAGDELKKRKNPLERCLNRGSNPNWVLNDPVQKQRHNTGSYEWFDLHLGDTFDTALWNPARSGCPTRRAAGPE